MRAHHTNRKTETQGYHDDESRELLGLDPSPLNRIIEFTTFTSAAAKRKGVLTASLNQLDRTIRKATATTKEGLPWIKGAIFGDVPTVKGSLRHDANVLRITAVEGDYDAGTITPEEAHDALKQAGITALVYTTPSHLQPGKGNRWRVIAPCSRKLPPGRRTALAARLNGLFGGVLGGESFALSQSYYYGSFTDDPPTVYRIEGRRWIDEADDLDAGAIGPPERESRAVEPESTPRDSDSQERTGLPWATFREAVMAIPNDDSNPDAASRAWWLNILASIHHEARGSAKGLRLALEWSRQWPDNDDDATEAAWLSFRRSRGTLRTGRSILAEAEKHGWNDAVDLLPDLGAEPGRRTSGLELVRAADVTPQPVSWLWPGRLARGKQTFIAGDPGMGKSQITIDVAARLSAGAKWPDRGRAPKGSVLILSAEDAIDDTIVPRLMAAGADLNKVYVVPSVRSVKGVNRAFSLQADLEILGDRIAEIPDAILVIVDPITSYMGGGVDSHRATDVRAVLEPLTVWAGQHGVAILAVTHPPKAAQGKAINALIGSQAYGAAARAVFLTLPEPDNTGRSLLLLAKTNLGRKPAGLGYHVVGTTVAKDIETSRIEWDSEAVTVTANEALRAEGEAAHKTRPVDEAEKLLRDLLAFGEAPADDVKSAAEEAGISPATLRRAKSNLRIQSKKDGMNGGWIWYLPNRE